VVHENTSNAYPPTLALDSSSCKCKHILRCTNSRSYLWYHLHWVVNRASPRIRLGKAKRNRRLHTWLNARSGLWNSQLSSEPGNSFCAGVLLYRKSGCVSLL
jgi:hypothetical protein